MIAFIALVLTSLFNLSDGYSFNVNVSKLAVGDSNNYYVNSFQEYIVQITNLTNSIERVPPRIELKCSECNEQNPVLVVVRQNKGVLSWELPIVMKSESYNETARTLCPYDIINSTCSSVLKTSCSSESRDNEDHSVTVSLSSSSEIDLMVTLKVELETDFVIELDKNKTIQITPSKPRFYLYEFPTDKNVTSILLHVQSKDDICSIVSIQNISCPVFDLERNIQYEGLFQTVTRQGGMTITRDMFPNGFYAVFVVGGEDDSCSSPLSTKKGKVKGLVVSVHKTISYESYVLAVGVTISAITAFYIIMGLISCFCFMRIKTDLFNFEEDQLYNNEGVSSSSYNARTYTIENAIIQSPTSPTTADTLSIKTDSSLDETDIDLLPDAESDKNIFRTKTLLYVCDLARKNPSVLKRKSSLYLWNLLTVATFYFLPVVQLVSTYQQQLNQSGKEDLCYYNFLCSHPLWGLSDFNHVFSNIAYLCLGLLFVTLTYQRESNHRKTVAKIRNLDRCYGIPQHFGIFYAMGAALVIEGIMSACYHVCPNKMNFQFDTSFMYVISTMCMIKIYQTRHPDINASAYATFFLLAFVILLGMCGVLRGTFAFWVFFTILHLSTCLYLSLQIYYMGRWSLDFCSLSRFWKELKLFCRSLQCRFFIPMYPGRFAFITFANLVNWALAIVKFRYELNDFASYLLSIFMVNLMLYTMFYIIMKFICKERILLQSWIYIILACLCWGGSLYFFFNKCTSWKETPAQSKIYNQECHILNFYDNHDVWHFISAFAMFFSFMVLLTLDDDLVYVHRSKIPVF